MSYGYKAGEQVGFLKLGETYVLKGPDGEIAKGVIKKLPTGTIAPGFGLQLVHVEYELGDETVTLTCGYQDRKLPGGWHLTDEQY